MTKRRLFIAINLPENVKKRLIDWRGSMSTRLRQDSGEVNWVRRGNLHITLIFIGYATDDETYDIAKKMRVIAKKHEAFNIKLERIITGPPNKMPRMFWVEGEKNQELADLHSDLENEIQQLSGGKYGAYRPHINLARFNYDIAKQITLSDWREDVFKAEIPVDSIQLMQSDLHRSGPEYTILESVNLGNDEL